LCILFLLYRAYGDVPYYHIYGLHSYVSPTNGKPQPGYFKYMPEWDWKVPSYANTWSGRYYHDDTPPPGGFLIALQDTKGGGRADKIIRFGPAKADGNAEAERRTRGKPTRSSRWPTP